MTGERVNTDRRPAKMAVRSRLPSPFGRGAGVRGVSSLYGDPLYPAKMFCPCPELAFRPWLTGRRAKGCVIAPPGAEFPPGHAILADTQPSPQTNQESI